MEAKLIVVGGKASKSKITLRLPTIVGRSREAGLTIAHPMISRQHCELFEADGLLMVRDLGSLNGTVCGGQRIKESPLPPDAEFTVGPLTFRAEYQYEGDLGKLPAPVLADQGTAAEGETPDFKAIDEPPAVLENAAEEEAAEPEPPLSPKTQKRSSKPANAAPSPNPAASTETVPAPKAKSAADPAELSDDLFDEFLKGAD